MGSCLLKELGCRESHGNHCIFDPGMFPFANRSERGLVESRIPFRNFACIRQASGIARGICSTLGAVNNGSVVGVGNCYPKHVTIESVVSDNLS